jgi:transcriptional regulator with XRE-family HTH domain
MQEQSCDEIFAAKVATRVRDFRTRRGLSADALAKAAGLSAAEMLLVEEGSVDMTVEMIDCIAEALGVHRIVFLMFPDEDPLASLLEPHRDLPGDEYQKVLGDLVLRGYQHSEGSA